MVNYLDFWKGLSKELINAFKMKKAATFYCVLYNLRSVFFMLKVIVSGR